MKTIVILRKVLNPKTGFTKHFLKTHKNSSYKKIIVTSKVDCDSVELEEIKNSGFDVIVSTKVETILKIKPDLIEIHGGLMTVFSYVQFFKALKEFKVLLFIHSTKFSLRDLMYLKFKDIFLERKYTIDGAFLANALMPVKVYLFVLVKVLKLKLAGVTIASKSAYDKYKRVFRRSNINFYYLHSGIEDKISGSDNRVLHKDGIVNIVSFSRAQFVRGYDILLNTVPYVVKHNTNFKIKLYLLPDISTHRIVKMAQRSNCKNYITIQIGKANIEKIFNEADMFVFLIRSMRVIPFQPLTVIEALNTGKVVITSNLPEMNELKEHYNNIVCVDDYKNPEKLAEIILKNINKKKLNNKDVKYYSWEIITDLQNKIYKEIIK